MGYYDVLSGSFECLRNISKKVKHLMIDNLSKEEPLKNRIQQILNSENLDTRRALISTIAIELGIDSLTCAAALTYLTQPIENKSTPVSFENNKTGNQLPTKSTPLGFKMVRYRLDVGSKHRITLEQLKKVLVEESGVDKNNINNINIQNLYTLIELPDEMPPDIFLHLKSVEINQHKLDIRRVKTRNNKSRGNNHIRRGRKRDSNAGNKSSDQFNGDSNKTVD
jgi:DbpA RNA binding domain